MLIHNKDKSVTLPEGASARVCLQKLDAFPTGTLAALSGGIVVELNDPIRSDCNLSPLTLADEEGRRIYERSLRFVMLLALKHLYPFEQVRIEYSVGYGVFVRLPGIDLHRQDIVRIENEMRRITEQDLPFVRKQWTREDAIAYFEEEQQPDKVELLKHRPAANITMYSIDDMWEYFYGAMTVSTGYVKVFTLFELRGGFVLQLPAGADFDHAAPYIYRPKHLEVFAQSARWCEILGINNVTDVTNMIEEKRFRNFIRVNEALHEKAIDEIAEKIVSDNKHIVLIAGPSSSGKTTFAGRLAIHLQTYGRKSRRFSLDDFFINRDETPLQPDGTRDLDDFSVLDLPLLADKIQDLLAGEEVDMPVFNFITGRREYTGDLTRLEPDEILILEGTHGLNPKLVGSFPAYEVHRIFVSALTCLNLDDHNRIRTTDVRLLRRIVRDMNTRGYSPEETLAGWPSVRRGEEKWIFAFQENADSMFNSALHYELPVLKHYAYALLKDIPPESANYLPARRLIKTLNYLPDPDEAILSEIPALSLLREFIGGSTMDEN